VVIKRTPEIGWLPRVPVKRHLKGGEKSRDSSVVTQINLIAKTSPCTPERIGGCRP
jgi:hypothetical protein